MGDKDHMDKSFDIVIVGAGSAGCVLANRLTVDPTVRVLLLEAGEWDRDPMIGVPVGIAHMTANNLYRWSDVSEPDPHLGGRRSDIAHGKVIGGGSSINYMAHTRGHPAIYDAWAEAGAPGWSYQEVLPYFKQCEAWDGGGNAWRGGEGNSGRLPQGSTIPLRPPGSTPFARSAIPFRQIKTASNLRDSGFCNTPLKTADARLRQEPFCTRFWDAPI